MHFETGKRIQAVNAQTIQHHILTHPAAGVLGDEPLSILMTNPFILWIEQTLGISQVTQWKLYATLLILLLVRGLQAVIGHVLTRRVADLERRYSLQKALEYTALGLGLLGIVRIWSEGLQSLATFFGLLSAGVAIALKDPLANLAGRVYILWRRPFDVGDRIEIGGVAGDVSDKHFFQFSLLEIGNWVDADQSTGRIVHVPNGIVFTAPVINYTQSFPFVWHEIAFTLTFESDWQAAKTALLEIITRLTAPYMPEIEKAARRASQKYLFKSGTITPIVYTRVAESGIELTARFLCPVRQRRTLAHEVYEAMLQLTIERPEIQFAYPTIRLTRDGSP
ncbi:MAG: mechanosensitive ion channel [Anaerolineales bacterium]